MLAPAGGKRKASWLLDISIRKDGTEKDPPAGIEAPGDVGKGRQVGRRPARNPGRLKIAEMMRIYRNYLQTGLVVRKESR